MSLDKNQIYNQRDECLLDVGVAILHFAMLVSIPLTVLNEVSQRSCVHKELTEIKLNIYSLCLYN